MAASAGASPTKPIALDIKPVNAAKTPIFQPASRTGATGEVCLHRWRCIWVYTWSRHRLRDKLPSQVESQTWNFTPGIMVSPIFEVYQQTNLWKATISHCSHQSSRTTVNLLRINRSCHRNFQTQKSYVFKQTFLGSASISVVICDWTKEKVHQDSTFKSIRLAAKIATCL